MYHSIWAILLFLKHLKFSELFSIPLTCRHYHNHLHTILIHCLSHRAAGATVTENKHHFTMKHFLQR